MRGITEKEWEMNRKGIEPNAEVTVWAFDEYKQTSGDVYSIGDFGITIDAPRKRFNYYDIRTIRAWGIITGFLDWREADDE